ncbi:MAG: GHMP kinase [Chloroflexota bacterium]|nr:GHMP kinase [Chloroflexota bacterium]
MLIARAPVRLSFAGGGTDLPAYYEKYGGAVVSTTLDKYFYVFLNVSGDDTIQITSSDYRTFYRHDGDMPLMFDGDLSLPRAILNHFGLTRGIAMFLASEIPPGTGLGSSSTVAVAIIKAVTTAKGLFLSKQQIAELACQIEIEKLGTPIGKQDQYAAAFGDLNLIQFTADGVTVEPLRISPETRRALEQNILLFFTGGTRQAATILTAQKRSSESDDPQVIAALHAVKQMAFEAKEILERGDLSRFGALLDAGWEQKKKFASGVSNPRIDECYALARARGALGGKLAGAGSGGFLMVYCEPPHHAAVTQALEAKELRRMDFRFETEGARVLVNAGLRIPGSAYAP